MKNYWWWVGGGLLAYSLLVPGNPIMTLLKTRGIRNNNPGNIRYNPVNSWRGQVGKDSGGFVVFDSPENGLRALARLLKNKVVTGRYTLVNLLASYAPSSENNTGAYVAAVSQRMQIPASAKLQVNHLPALIDAIVTHENGKNPYPADMIQQAIVAAG